MQKQHAARVEKVRRWLSKPETRHQVGILYLCTRTLDAVMYFLMGGNRPGEGRSGRPGTVPWLDEQLPIQELIGEVRCASQGLMRLLQTWGDREVDSTVLLGGIGVSDDGMHQESTIRFVRRMDGLGHVVRLVPTLRHASVNISDVAMGAGHGRRR